MRRGMPSLRAMASGATASGGATIATSRIRKICNLASMPSTQRRGAETSVPQIVAIGFRDDLPAVGKLHRHQIVGEIARRQLAAHLDEGGVVVGTVDRDDEVLTRLA